MSLWDWLTLLLTLAGVIFYGVHKGRGQQGAQTYLLAGQNMPWYVVLLGIMATQASAITFLSAPGQAYTDGMRFLQYYFGLPVAMVVICITFIPVFRKLNVYTAYEYLEHRFDKKTRVLISILFLLSRGLSTGISIYAPAIILSSILGWNIYLTNILTGGLLIIYTYTGGAKAIAHTQKLQFLIILSAVGLAGYMAVRQLPEGVHMQDALFLAGKAGKLNVITTGFDWKSKYNIWSGIIGGFFLALSYFGTDQSQVGRYITAKTADESRVGLLLNGLIKIPMQFLILLIGALLFALYALKPAPLYFNEQAYQTFRQQQPALVHNLEDRYSQLSAKQSEAAHDLLAQRKQNNTVSPLLLQEFTAAQKGIDTLRNELKEHMSAGIGDANDTNYIFLYFVKHTLPKGLVGLLFAVIFLASWGSISAALNSLTSSSVMDLQYVFRNDPYKQNNKVQQLKDGRLHTLCWGIFCIAVAMFATRMGSLIEAVNILGSLFYGTILGVFLVAFYFKRAGGNHVFFAALLTELLVITIYVMDIVSFLWLNVIGAMLVIVIAWIGSRWKTKHENS